MPSWQRRDNAGTDGASASGALCGACGGNENITDLAHNNLFLTAGPALLKNTVVGKPKASWKSEGKGKN
jgi:hypothetical protein